LSDAPKGLSVGYVVESLPAFVVEEVLELRRQGVGVTLLSAFRPVAEADPSAEALRQESLYFPPRYRGVLSANLEALRRSPAAYLGAARALLAQGESLRLLVLGAHLARLARRRGLWHLHGTFGTRTTTLAYVVARLMGVGFSFTTHAYDIFQPNPSLPWKVREAEFMRTISDYNRAFVRQAYALADARIEVVRLGVDLERFRPLQGTPPAGPPVVVSVAALVPKKGLGYLIDACAELRGRGIAFACEILGEGPLRPDLEAAIAARGLSGLVSLPGRVPHPEVCERVRRAAVFALPCTDERASGAHMDGIPVALMEAMALQKPVVSTPLSGIPELVEHGVSGLLVAQRDSHGLADALASLLTDGARREALGQAARSRVERDFDLRQSTARLAALMAAAYSCRSASMGSSEEARRAG
jgi:glycosyltransferase involved in cell wall biosynthesis